MRAGGRGWSVSKWFYASLGGLMLVCLATAVWKDAELDAERSAHEATRAALKQAITACEQMERRAESLRQALTEAHKREAAWALEETARAEIVKKAKPGPRPPEERDQVVDDATRRDAMLRLNMAW